MKKMPDGRNVHDEEVLSCIYHSLHLSPPSLFSSSLLFSSFFFLFYSTSFPLSLLSSPLLFSSLLAFPILFCSFLFIFLHHFFLFPPLLASSISPSLVFKSCSFLLHNFYHTHYFADH